MAEDLKASAQRVQDFLTQKGFDFVVKEFPSSTRTSQEAADSIGCKLDQIAKSLIFKDKKTEQAVLVIASGSNRVDTKKIKTEFGFHLTRADADFVRENVGYAIGGIPPVAHNKALTTILDTDLQNHTIIWAAAGTPNAVFELTPAILAELTEGAWLDLSQ